MKNTNTNTPANREQIKKTSIAYQLHPNGRCTPITPSSYIDTKQPIALDFINFTDIIPT